MMAYTFGNIPPRPPEGKGEIQFCSYCGARLDAGARFCKKCGKPVNQPAPSPKNYAASYSVPKGGFSDKQRATSAQAKEREQSYSHVTVEEPIATRKTVFEGELHKCPNCGEVLESFVVNCPSCGFEFRGAKSATSVREFAAKLEEIEKARPLEKTGFWKKSSDQDKVSGTEQKKISLIRSFAIPNTKEDLFEFLVLASSNINVRRHSDPGSISESERAVSDAWEAKFEQAYEKAKLSFGHTREFKKFHAIYEKKRAQIATSKRKQALYVVGAFAFLILMLIGMNVLLGWDKTTDAKKIAQENKRLDAIVEEVYAAIADENYVLARAKATNLVFSGSTTDEGEQAVERWDKTRAELLAIIDEAANETSSDLPENNVSPDSEKKPDEPGQQPVNNHPENETDDSVAGTDAAPRSDEREEKPEPPVETDPMKIPADFIAGHEEAEFGRFNSPASENGLGGSLIYIVGTLERTEIFESSAGQSIVGYLTDENDNSWLLLMHFLPAVTETYYDAAVGKNVVCTTAYEGYSEVAKMPAAALEELMILEDGTTFAGMQKLLAN